MSDCAERHLVAPLNGLVGEGREGTPMEVQS
jgi:hypothetical protein